jgi:hypothetical protein
MKYLSVLLLSLLLIGMAGSAVAKGPKNDIMHCGCVYVADEGSMTTGTASMEWKLLSIKNGKGHVNHVVNQEDDCLSGYEEVLCTQEDVDLLVEGCTEVGDILGYTPLTTLFYRHNDDCLVDGPLDFLALCDNPDTELVDETPVEGTDCGFDYPFVPD